MFLKRVEFNVYMECLFHIYLSLFQIAHFMRNYDNIL